MAVMWMCLIVIATCRETIAATFSLRVPEGPISAPLGGSVVLSCVTSFDPDELKWYRPGQRDHPVLQYENRKIQEEAADPQYRGRAFLTAGLQKGDVSLRLDKLTLADRGQYVCYVHDGVWFEEANVSLIVRVTGSAPVMSSSITKTGKHVNVSCVSHGWTPQPTLIWRDKSNTEIRTNSDQVYFYDEDGLVAVRSWLLYSSSESEWLSCSVGLSDQERRESRIMPTKNIIIQSGLMTGPFLIMLLVLSMLIIGFVILYRKGVIQFAVASESTSTDTSPPGDKKAEAETLLLKGNMDLRKEIVEKGRNIEEKEEVQISMNIPTPDWEHVKTYQVKRISLDPNTVHDPLKLLKDGENTRVKCFELQEAPNPKDKFPLISSCENFEHGQHCWVVNLWGEIPECPSNEERGYKSSWFVGVCQKKRLPLFPRKGLWGLQFERETRLFANTKPPTPVEISIQFRRLGVFLDCDKHTLSFYSVDTQSHLYTFEGVNSDRLFAAISPGIGDREWMEICAA